MRLLVHATPDNPYGKRLLPLLRQEFSADSLTVAVGPEQLLLLLKSPVSHPDCVVVLISDRAELSQLLSIRRFLHDIQIILVLPPSSDDLVVEAHTLRPRFLTFADADFSDLIAVLRRLWARTETQRLAAGGV